MNNPSKHLSALVKAASSSGINVRHIKEKNLLVFRATTKKSEEILKKLAETLIDEKFYVEMFWRWNPDSQENKVHTVVIWDVHF